MTRNIGDADRTARVIGGAVTGLLFSTHRDWGNLTTALGVVSVLLLLSSVTGWSLLYAIFRFSTYKPEDSAPRKD